jgi:hypothetical protein
LTCSGEAASSSQGNSWAAWRMPTRRRWSLPNACHSAWLGPVDQRQHLALLVAQMPMQPGGQGVDGVPQPLVAAVAVGQRALDGVKQRVDAGVLVLHGLQQGQLVGTVGQVGAHAWPQVVVLGGVVDV